LIKFFSLQYDRDSVPQRINIDVDVNVNGYVPNVFYLFYRKVLGGGVSG